MPCYGALRGGPGVPTLIEKRRLRDGGQDGSAEETASENAGRLINELQIAYNKARQATSQKSLKSSPAPAAV